MRFLKALPWLLLVSCNSVYEMSLTQYSKARAEQIFQEEEKKELRSLFRYLLDLDDAPCAHVQRALNDSQALLDVEKRYDLKILFIYTELLSVSARDIIAAIGTQESLERKTALAVISVWKEAAASTQELDSVIIKIRKCHPQDYKTAANSKKGAKTSQKSPQGGHKRLSVLWRGFG